MSDDYPIGIAVAVRECGLELRRAWLLSPLGTAKGIRIAYRVETECGKTIKAREFESEAVAESICELRSVLAPAFAPVIRRSGCIVIEEWIEGSPLSGTDERSRLREAGSILGALHSQAIPGGKQSLSTDEWHSSARSDLVQLSEAELISTATASVLAEKLADADPLEAAASLIHFDYCVENMLIDRRGQLCIIDNERISIAPPEMDLAWTFFRWPLAARSQSFLEGYRSSAGSLPHAMNFWNIVAVLLGSRVYMRCAPERVAPAVALLRGYAEVEKISVQGNP